MQSKKTGTLYVVATPIGNLQDITLRAIEVLKSVDKIIAEDTRLTGRLLKHFSIQKPSVALHNFNEEKKVVALLAHLQAGENLALVSDAGTPLISDPGFQLVRHAKLNDIPVVPVPGPSAFVAALSAAGLPCDRFVFEGFLPVKTVARKKYLQSLIHETCTLVFYEAPHRLMETLNDMQLIFGAEREAAVARELTKIHETILVNTIGELRQYFFDHADKQRGEIVILVSGNKEVCTSNDIQAATILPILLDELSVKQAVEIASKITGQRKNLLYQSALKISQANKKNK